MAGPRSRIDLFDAAIAKRNLSAAWLHASEMGHVPLDRALRLTILMGELQDPGYERTARRFLVRFILEISPTLEQTRRIADALDQLRYGAMDIPGAADTALKDLAGQLAKSYSGRPSGGPADPRLARSSAVNSHR